MDKPPEVVRRQKHDISSFFSQRDGRILYAPVYKRRGRWTFYSSRKQGLVCFPDKASARFFFEKRHITDY